MVLAAGVLLVGALLLFLVRSRLRDPLNLKELPKKLGVNITQDATGFTMDHSFGGHSRYRIHAAKVAQFKDNHAILRDVEIDLFGEDGSRVDRIAGAEFDYDQKAGRAVASGPVEIMLMRPGVRPAIASEARAGNPQAPKPDAKAAGKSGVKADARSGGQFEGRNRPTPIASVAENAARGEVQVKTSGLSFDTRSGLASTAEHVDFSMVQGSGSSLGASYDEKGFLVLDKDVELRTERGGRPVVIHAQHAEFERTTLLCTLHAAAANFRGMDATAGDASVLFRDDGSAQHLEAMHGFNLVTSTGGHINAPSGSMDFDEQNKPLHGRLQGGVAMDSTRPTGDGSGQRRSRATAATAEMAFDGNGELRHAHLERGVEMSSETVSESGSLPLRVRRSWTSPIADVDFRDNGHGQAEPAKIHGVQGVVVTGESQRGAAAPQPSRLAADDVTGVFGADSALTAMTGEGHASVEQTNAAGTRQTSTGDRLEVHFTPGGKGSVAAAGAGQVESAILDGHVVLVQQAAAKAGAPAPAPLYAWAGRAAYEGGGEWLHLTLSPRVQDGALQLTAEKIDVSHESGDAFAHGNVKATWLTVKKTPPGETRGGVTETQTRPAEANPVLGGQGPAHIVASEAQLMHAAGGQSGAATFKGHARLWQQANSVTAPIIILDRQKQTLAAHASDPNEPVKVVLLSAGGIGAIKPPDSKPAQDRQQGTDEARPRSPSVIRVRGGDLDYSDGDHTAIMRSGALGKVEAETATATTDSDEVELLLRPSELGRPDPGRPDPGHPDPGRPDRATAAAASQDSAPGSGSSSQVERMTASGHVVVSSGDRRGTGDQLVYTGETGDYVLTGSPAVPPRMTDPGRGTITGHALIFHSRDDSVSIDGAGGRTTTETTAPK
jgi:lipopolysaccharide export system protein LptA